MGWRLSLPSGSPPFSSSSTLAFSRPISSASAGNGTSWLANWHSQELGRLLPIRPGRSTRCGLAAGGSTIVKEG
jgi:hypothetical protein